MGQHQHHSSPLWGRPVSRVPSDDEKGRTRNRGHETRTTNVHHESLRGIPQLLYKRKKALPQYDSHQQTRRMVANVGAPSMTSTTKKSAPPPNIRTGTVHPPVLVSPISVAHGNAMLGPEASKKGANWMRDQWVANLKKKRMASTTGSGVAPANTGSCSSSAGALGPVPSVKAGIRAEASRSGGEKAPTRSKRSNKSTKANATNAPHAAASSGYTSVDKESLSLLHPAMFFNDLGCFELESPSFMRLTPRDGSMGAMPSPGAALKNDKKWVKPLMKKRSSCFAADSDSEPKRRTPRRTNRSSGSFDDSDVSSICSSPHSYTSVGTPSNFLHHNGQDVSRMWGPELDFPNGYADTFLDLPTPKCAAMPTVTATSSVYSASSSTRNDNTSQHELEQPRLVRTTSIEQEGLSQFFEQATIDGVERKCYTNAVTGAVDECFGMITPRAFRYDGFQSTPKGSLRVHHSGDYRFETAQKRSSSAYPGAASSSEFDALVHEYEFTDFDQELDSFYLDTIESFGGDLDLISH